MGFSDITALIDLRPADAWTDLWFWDQDDRNLRSNDGWWTLQRGVSTGQGGGEAPQAAGRAA